MQVNPSCLVYLAAFIFLWIYNLPFLHETHKMHYHLLVSLKFSEPPEFHCYHHYLFKNVLLLALLVSASPPTSFNALSLSCYTQMHFSINCKLVNFRIQNTGEYLLVCSLSHSFFSCSHVLTA